MFSLPFAKGLSDSRFADGLTNVMALLKTGGLKRNKRFQMSFCAPIYINQTAYLASANVRELNKHSERTIYRALRLATRSNPSQLRQRSQTNAACKTKSTSGSRWVTVGALSY